MILKNFKLKKGISIEEYPAIKLINSDYIFTDIPICEIDIDDEDNDLYIIDVHPTRNIAKAVSKEKIQEILQKTKIFHFKSLSDDKNQSAKIIETTKEESQLSMRLPIDTPVDKLVVINGEIMMLDNQVELSEGDDK